MVIPDNGNEFNGLEFQELLQSFGITAKPTTVKTPQESSMTERTHLTIVDMLHTIVFEEENYSDEFNTTLKMVAWAVRSMISIAIHHSPE